MTDPRWAAPTTAPHASAPTARAATATPQPPRKRRRGRPVLIAGAVIAALAAGAFGYQGITGRPQGTPQAVELADATISDDLASATVLGVGEATHGTSEFRVAWRLIAEKLADKGFTTIAWEENAGTVSQVDAWVQGGPGTAEDAAKRFGFKLNRIRETADFLSWARHYNEGKPAEQRIRFYGLDMQRAPEDRDVALAWLSTVDAPSAATLTEKLKPITRDTNYDKAGAASMQPVAEELKKKVDAAAAGRRDDATLRAQLSAAALVQGMKRGQNVAGYDRDADLAANLTWLVKQRAAAGGQHTLLLAHNGHVGHGGRGSMAPGSKLGALADQAWGPQYKVIGTDAHVVGMAIGGETHRYTVNSPVRGLFAGTTIGYLETAQATGENKAVLEQSLPSASAGSEFPGWYAFVPFLNSMPITHAQAWDALVYVNDSHPVTPLP